MKKSTRNLRKKIRKHLSNYKNRGILVSRKDVEQELKTTVEMDLPGDTLNEVYKCCKLMQTTTSKCLDVVITEFIETHEKSLPNSK